MAASSEVVVDRSERKRRDILAAARELFTQEGYAGAGMETVSRMASVSTATLYSHFPSKADLFRRVVEEAVEGYAAAFRASADMGGDAREQLLSFAEAYARFLSDPSARALFRVVSSERKRFEHTAAYFAQQARAACGGVLITVLKRLAREGRLQMTHPAWAAGQLLGMIEHPLLVMSMLDGDDAVPSRPQAQICRDAVDTFLARYAVKAEAGAPV